MSRMLIAGCLGAIVAGLGMAVTGLSPWGFLSSGESRPSLQQLRQERAQLEELKTRIATRLALKRELMEMLWEGSVGWDEVIDQWVWLNNQKPWFPVATGTMYSELSSRQIAMLQVLIEIEDGLMFSVPTVDLFDLAADLDYTRGAVLSGFHPQVRENTIQAGTQTRTP